MAKEEMECEQPDKNSLICTLKSGNRAPATIEAIREPNTKELKLVKFSGDRKLLKKLQTDMESMSRIDLATGEH